MAAWKGPVNYIVMVEAFKEGPHSTTPLRICMNSALKQPPPSKKSLNDILMKGPSALVDLCTVTLSVREFRYALTKDLSKFYQCVLANELAQHVRRILWRDGDSGRPPDVYATTTVNFGDKPAGCIAIAALRKTATMYGDQYPEAQYFLKYRTYVDDATAGADTQEDLERLSADLELIAGHGGFKFKKTLKSGDPADPDEELPKVLGLLWDTAEDKLQIDVKVNFGVKKKGAHTDPYADLEDDPVDFVPEVVTKRMLWRVAQAQYDPLGLLSVYTIKFKLLMRDLCSEELKIQWDDPVTETAKERFMQLMDEMGDLRKTQFPRSLKPAESRGPWKEDPMLLVFGDGSTQASCALAYIRWELQDGSVLCRLIAGKTRVAPKVKITVPRMELVGSLMAVRLAQKVKDSLCMEFKAMRYFTVSSAVLGMLKGESRGTWSLLEPG